MGILFFFIFFNRSLLEYNCFTITCQFLLHNKANQSYAYTCPHIPSLMSLPPTPLGHRKAPSQSPCAMLLLPTSQLFYIWQCIYVGATLTSSQLRPPTLCLQVHSLRLPLYAYPATRFISTIFCWFVCFLDSIYMRQHTVFVFLFLTYFTWVPLSTFLHEQEV